MVIATKKNYVLFLEGSFEGFESRAYSTGSL